MALLKADIDPVLSRLRMPVLCVAGRQSEWFVNQMNKAVERFACAQKAVIEDAIYPSHLCQPREYNRILLNF
ncbi:hypothetical protein VQ056_03275 [Paenibacillus sp. JTLBN-2024]